MRTVQIHIVITSDVRKIQYPEFTKIVIWSYLR